ncbi:MAG: U32 family peptidase [Candidatus Methanomethylophilaceae archaeon]|nr:U32 family peptidase [Candidatus Methanomethylophilaceae archaeon]
MEILAPAGSPEGLVAAIKGGCDAVYMGGPGFGARAFAKNFTDAELEGAIEYAHRHGVKVNVTVNTIIKNSEMGAAVSYVQFLKDIGADAIIIQDLGLLNSIKHIPIAKHASTQMGIHSREGLQWCADNGISRAILARELTLDEIEEIVRDSPVETEVFIQGAMCYSMSGGCLFSSIVGGRSGNRGECAQPCRKKYHLPEGDGYFLSNADIYGMEAMDRLRSAGITSLKIEGRMRSPAYAYLSSKAYSMANKGMAGEELDGTISLLKTVFNRGFCQGYLGGVDSLVQSSYPDNRGLFMGSFEVRNKKFPIKGTDINFKDGISLFKSDTKVGGFKVADHNWAVAPFAIPDGMYDVYRTYDPRLDEIKNLIGRAPKLSGGKVRRGAPEFSMPKAERRTKKADISVYVSSMKVLDAVLPYADRIYYDGESIGEAEKACTGAGKEFVRVLPRFEPFVSDNGEYPVMAHNPGQVQAYRGRRTYGSYILNMFNSAFPDSLYQTTLSVEMTRNEIRETIQYYPGRVEQMVFGRTELMFTRDPHLAQCVLRDEREYEFPVYRDGTGARILNSSDTMLLDRVGELERYGVDSLGIDLRKRPVKLASEVTSAFRRRDTGRTEEIRRLCGGTLNTGHYLRGV